MIRSFADKRTARIFSNAFVRDLHPDLQRRARAKLLELEVAKALDELRITPGNHLEKLGGDRKGQWSIRVSGQWRICFRWEEGDAFDVWFGDFH